MTETAPARLYHAPSSYYSMIARLALIEGGIGFTPVPVDIHGRMAQLEPDYVRLNRHMTVPTLVLPDRILDESRDIALFAFGLDPAGLDPEIGAWLDRHYRFPIEELTFGWLLSRNPLARFAIPRRLAAARDRMLALAAAHPDLAEAYRARAAVFAGRVRTFDPGAVRALGQRRTVEALGLLDALEARLSDGRAVLAPPAYGPADVVWTVFLARIRFVALGAEIARRPAVARYMAAAEARPSFAAADIWTRLSLLRLIGGIFRAGS